MIGDINNKSNWKKYIVEVISFLFIFLFVYAATSKLLEYSEFQMQLGQSPVIGPAEEWIAPGVILAEFGVSTLLLLPKLRLQGLYLSLILMVMFTTYIVIVLKFSDFLPCSCGGVLEDLGWTEHLLFNGVFVILAFLGIFSIPIKRKS